MNQENNSQEFEIQHAKINSRIEIVYNKRKKCYELQVIGVSDTDRLFLRINKLGSGAFGVDPSIAFPIIDGFNKKLSIVKIKNTNDK